MGRRRRREAAGNSRVARHIPAVGRHTQEEVPRGRREADLNSPEADQVEGQKAVQQVGWDSQSAGQADSSSGPAE